MTERPTIGVARGVLFWRAYRRNGAALLGLGLSMMFVFLALLAPLLSGRPPMQSGERVFQAPGREFLLGTDDFGRDVWSGIVHGARVSLVVGLFAAATSTIVGLLVGGAAGYAGGWLDDALMRVADFFQVVPRFLLALVILTFFPPSLTDVVLVIGLLSWPLTARLVRAEFLTLRERLFVEAAKALGVGHAAIVLRHILPNALAPVVVAGSLQVASAILIEAGLSFLGLSDPAVISWGRMLNNAQHFLHRGWWIGLFPGLAIFLTTLGLNLLGDGINDILNPRRRGRLSLV